MPDFVTLFALLGVVLTVSALASGLVERAPISFPILFLGLGFLLGPRGFGLLELDVHDATLEAVGVVSLAFVLFLDAIRLRPAEIGRGWLILLRMLGPGTLLVVLLIAGAAWLLLRTSLVESLLLGAILASTDPVVLRDVIRNPRLPGSIRQALGIEAGTNDLVVLPLVLVLIAVARAQAETPAGWLLFLARIFLLSPLVGFAVGGAGAWLMAKVDAKMGISRVHQALFGVGLVLVAYVVGVAVNGDGFLSAFAAGAAIVILDLELCDCFLEYGETTAEMAMLLAFVLFGVVLSTLLGTIPLWPALGLAAVTILVARPLAITVALHRAAISPSARWFIGWFGPRGLSSLLLALLAVRDHVPQAERLLAITGVVVIASVVLHGVTATPVAAWYGERLAHQKLPEERESTAAGLVGEEPAGVPRVTAEELAERLAGPDPPLVLDVRRRADLAEDPDGIPGGVRVLPDRLVAWAADQSRARAVVAYCT